MTRNPEPPPACICCANGRWRPYCTGLTQCTSCGYVHTSASYSPEELHAIYREAYFRGEEYRDYPADREVIEATLRRRLSRVRHRVAPGGRLIEIGCAYGFFLDLARSTYPDPIGVDVAEAATAWARRELNVDARTGDLATLDVPHGFDVACLWDTIEHLADPSGTIERLAERVTPSGWLLLTTGDVGAMVPRLQQERWRMIHPPSHLHYFTRPAMRAFLRRRGFAVRRITSCAVDRSVEQIVHGLSRFGGLTPVRRATAWLHRRLPAPVARARIGLDIGDIMLVEAQRVTTE